MSGRTLHVLALAFGAVWGVLVIAFGTVALVVAEGVRRQVEAEDRE